MKNEFNERKCFILTCIVVVSFLFLPFLPYGNMSSRILMLFYTGVMITAPFFFAREKKLLRVLVITGIVLAILEVAGLILAIPDKGFITWIQLSLDVISLGFQLFWVGFVIHSAILIRKLKEPVFGCILAYILMGTVFGNIFFVMQTYAPGSFTDTTKDLLTHPDLIYFSFVTLTTCGFGDIVPVLPLARMTASIEAICGVMYVAMFIGRVISEKHAVVEAEAKKEVAADTKSQTASDK